MNIMSMLVRLQGALGSTDLIDQVILLPERRSANSWTKHLKASGPRHSSKRQEEQHWQALAAEAESRSELNLVVGYNSSPKSQTALDLTLWIAHQTRLATRKQVTVQVVYVVDPTSCLNAIPNTPADLQKAVSKQAGQSNRRQKAASLAGATSSSKTLTRQRSNTAVAVSPTDSKLLAASDFPQCQTQQFEQADRILWQARCLANEWRGSLKTHLRFGDVAQELKRVVEDESATLLWLGCDSPDNTVVQKLGSRFPCPVLGVPPTLHPDRYFE